jgi:hypothetical protein
MRTPNSTTQKAMVRLVIQRMLLKPLSRLTP